MTNTTKSYPLPSSWTTSETRGVFRAPLRLLPSEIALVAEALAPLWAEAAGYGVALSFAVHPLASGLADIVVEAEGSDEAFLARVFLVMVNVYDVINGN